MSAPNRAGERFARYSPLVVVAACLLAGYVWTVQPRVGDYEGLRADRVALELRVRRLQDTVNRGGTAMLPDEAPAMRLFEERTSPDDKVSEAIEMLAQAAAKSAPKDGVRRLGILTGVSTRWQPGQQAPVSSRAGGVDGPDPRFALFGTPLTYTPVTIAFESTYETITSFVWQLRDLPTTIELRSMELTRGLPLMRATIQIFVYQRGAPPTAGGLPGLAPAGSTSVTAPRVARLSTARVW